MPATLLLADDSTTIQRVISLTFANESVRVVTAPDGASALARVTAEPPDVVLVDVALPGLDGYELTTRLKGSPEWSRIPVLMLTGAFDPVDETRARQVGCSGVLVKPLDPVQMVAIVKALLAGQQPAQLWPADMPRVDPRPGAPTPVHKPAPPPPAPASPAAPVGFGGIGEPGPLPPPSAVEAVFEIGLDDLDRAFSRLDPSAAPSRLDADTVSDFQRDIQELRSTGPGPDVVVERGMTSTPLTHLPVEHSEVVDAGELDWDLPTPGTVINAIPLPASFPDHTPAVHAIEPESPPVPEPRSVPVQAPPPAPPVPEPPPAPAAGPAPSLATAFSALLAAERVPPAAHSAPAARVSDADVEEVVRRVVTRMTDEVVRKVVAETTERLIREEMERLNR